MLLSQLSRFEVGHRTETVIFLTNRTELFLSFQNFFCAKVSCSCKDKIIIISASPLASSNFYWLIWSHMRGVHSEVLERACSTLIWCNKQLRKVVEIMSSHNKLNNHLNKMVLSSWVFPNYRGCNTQPETAKHFSWHCPMLETLRAKYLQDYYLTPEEIRYIPGRAEKNRLRKNPWIRQDIFKKLEIKENSHKLKKKPLKIKEIL